MSIAFGLLTSHPKRKVRMWALPPSPEDNEPSPPASFAPVASAEAPIVASAEAPVASAEAPVASAEAPAKARRGRKPGPFQSKLFTQLRGKFFQKFGVATPEEIPQAAHSAVADRTRSASTEHDEDCLAARMQGAAQLGDPLMNSIITSVKSYKKNTVSEQTAQLEKVLNDVCGDEPKVLMGSDAHSRLLDVPRRTLNAAVQDIAAVVHYGSRAWLASIFSRVLTMIEAKVIEPVASCLYPTYDETPLPLKSVVTENAQLRLKDRRAASEALLPSVVGTTGRFGLLGKRPRRLKGLAKVSVAYH